jgi:hypothetical protein
VKLLFLDAGIAMFLLLAFGNKVFGLAEFPARLRMVRLVAGVVALACVLTGAYWK